MKESVSISLRATLANAHPNNVLVRDTEKCAAKTNLIYGIQTPIPNVDEWHDSVYKTYDTATQLTCKGVKFHSMTVSQNDLPVQDESYILSSKLIEAECINIINTVQTAISCGVPSETGAAGMPMPPTEEQLEEAGGESDKCFSRKAHSHCTPDMEQATRDSDRSSAGSSAVMFSLVVAIVGTMAMFQSN